jgi:hypothetical protein
MRKSTNKLTKHELNFALDTAYPLAKHQITQKVNHQFQELGQLLLAQYAEHELILHPEYKITKGENYKQMPYQVLDFPRISGKDFAFCCRTLFWWGHYYSCNVLVRTDCIDIDQTVSRLEGIQKVKFWVGPDLWEHDVRSVAYLSLKKMSKGDIAERLHMQPYLKLAFKISIKKSDHLPQLALDAYQQLFSLIGIKKDSR